MYTEIPKAEATDHFELRPESMVLRIEHDQSSKVTSVVYVDDLGVMHRQKARAVCIAGNSIETPRLLLNSESSLFPDGLGNDSGNVGRHYLKHVFVRLLALMPGQVNMQRGIQQAGSLGHESHHDSNRGFISGYHIETAPVTPEILAKSLSTTDWGADYASLIEQYSFFASALICGEDISQADNRITLHANRKDKHGLPIPVVHYRDHANNRAMLEHAISTTTAIYDAVGAKKVFPVPMLSAGHNMGTCRMAETEADGVSNKWGNVFGIKNLFVSDGSQFSSAMTANPTLTIVALAIRQAEYIRDQLGKRNL